MIMRELWDMEGFRIGGIVVNNLRYADDTVIVAESEEQLHGLINVVVAKSEEKGLHLNFENWLYRKMLRISWKDRITNYEIYRRMALLGDIVIRQLSFLGHVLRKDELKKLVVTGFVDGKRARGIQQETFLTYLGRMKQKPLMELLQMAKNRTVWSKLCT